MSVAGRRPDDTIVAAATPLARSALAVIRIDGPDSARILQTLTRTTSFTPRLAVHVELWKEDGAMLDDVVVTPFFGPSSFTGNDLMELTLHGNPALVQRAIREIVSLGARHAEQGEFSERAVLNGKIDLVQAEAISELINSRTALQAQLLLGNLQGVLSRRAASVRRSMLDAIVRLEASLDFSEEGYDFIDRVELERVIGGAIAEVEAMSRTYQRGAATSSGLAAVILGRPNAGKSSLLNRLVGSDRAIVTSVAGTTRDIIRETLEIGGLPVTVADTAGLRESEDPVEGIGIERARAAARSADLVLYLVDAQIGLTEADRLELGRFTHAQVIFTKTDLAPAPAGEFGISVTEDKGVDELLRRLDEQVRDQFVAAPGSVINDRQHLAVEGCLEGLREATRSIAEGYEEQIVLVDLHRAARALGTLTGAILTDEILAEIFSKFCIGK
ncbi:MAG: tRNA uridine-5-carboxymethylaminomethyl(34) synthesis GTPase MnmE [Thermoanaerobaculia bacterium]